MGVYQTYFSRRRTNSRLGTRLHVQYMTTTKETKLAGGEGGRGSTLVCLICLFPSLRTSAHNSPSDWLVDRRHCEFKWHSQAREIHERVGKALGDLPPSEKLDKLKAKESKDYSISSMSGLADCCS